MDAICAEQIGSMSVRDLRARRVQLAVLDGKVRRLADELLAGLLQRARAEAHPMNAEL